MRQITGNPWLGVGPAYGQAKLPGPGGTLWPINVNQRLQPPNAYNSILQVESDLWGYIQARGGMTKLCPGSADLYPQPPWVKQPSQGKRYSKISSIALPAADATDYEVLSFYVPLGFDGVIISTVNLYTGTGFEEGSGDLTWRIKLNQRYVKDYGAITTSIGSLQTPYNINSGAIRIQSRQLVQYIVNRSVASGGNLNGGRIVCGLFGWYWPR
jgi:hypothetical protein